MVLSVMVQGMKSPAKINIENINSNGHFVIFHSVITRKPNKTHGHMVNNMPNMLLIEARDERNSRVPIFKDK